MSVKCTFLFAADVDFDDDDDEEDDEDDGNFVKNESTRCCALFPFAFFNRSIPLFTRSTLNCFSPTKNAIIPS